MSSSPRAAARTASAVRPAAVEPLESRQLLSASLGNVVYLETNNPTPGGNGILAYRQDPASGKLTQIGSKPFYTEGTGYLNATNALGPDDSDKEIVVTPDHKLLFAVNQGSNTVATFRIRPDGSLKKVEKGVFRSGGTQPVSLALSKGNLYVLNRGDEVQGKPATVAPSVVGFKVKADGRVSKIAGGSAAFAVGTSPSNVLVSNDGKALFVDLFTPPPLLNVATANTIVPFKVRADGSLKRGTPVGAPVAPPLILGLAQHPTQRIVYAGLVGAARLGVFTYDADAALTLAGSAPNAGGAICWLEVSGDGKYLYSSDSGTDSVGVYSLADPLRPVQIQELQLGGPRNAANDPTKPLETVNFQLQLDPSGNRLFVLNHQTAADGKFTAGNQLHALDVNGDGTLVERLGSTTFFSSTLIPNGAHPQGLAVIA